MNRICGWFGPASSDGPPEQVLATMAGDLSRGTTAAYEGRAEAAAGLAVTGPEAKRAGHFDGPVWAAVAGRPDWSTDALTRLAAERGHGAAAVEAYRRYGKDFVKQITGPFSLALLDRAAQRALLAIDRFAVHTMCYGTGVQGPLVFGSTTDAVRRHPAVTSTVSPQEIYNFLFYFACPAPKTIYAEQNKLLPAQRLWFEHGAVDTDFFWRPPYREHARADADELAAQLKDRLAGAVGRIAAREPDATIGAFLSGGLDSSTVVALLKGLDRGRPKTFTVTFGEQRFDESPFANTVARYFDTDHREYRLTPQDVLALLPRIAETYDEPFGNSSAIPTFYCARLAKENGVDVLLAGDGGDELFAGNAIYVEQLTLDLYNRIPRVLRSHVIEPVAYRLPMSPKASIFRKARNLISYAAMPMPDRMQRYNFWRATDKAEIFEPGILDQIDESEPLRIRRAIYQGADSDSLLQRMMHLDMTAALADSDLRKVNRMCELAGVRAHYPFLDEDVADLAARVPPGRMIRGRRLRDFYRQAIKDILPRQTLEKKKHGFGMPFEQWLKEDPNLRALAQDALKAFRRRGYVKDAFLDQVAVQHARPETAPSDEIVWDIVNLELWLQARGHT